MSGLLKRARLQGLLALALWVGGPAEAADPLYVQAPRLALREQPGLDGRVLDHLVTNTRVQRLSIEGSWCKVQTSSHQGFVDCRDLAHRPIRLQTVVAQLQNVVASLDEGQITQFEWLDLLQKKFWIQPALGSLYDYGHALDRVYDGHKFDEDYEKSGLPSNRERLSEFSGRPGPYRPARPEFEAMKDYLRKTGFIVSPAPRELVAVKLEPAVRAVLPRIKPSFLGRQPVPLLAGPRSVVAERVPGLFAHPCASWTPSSEWVAWRREGWLGSRDMPWRTTAPTPSASSRAQRQQTQERSKATFHHRRPLDAGVALVTSCFK